MDSIYKRLEAVFDEYVWDPLEVLVLELVKFGKWIVATAPGWLAVFIAWYALEGGDALPNAVDAARDSIVVELQSLSDASPPMAFVPVRNDLALLVESPNLLPEERSVLRRILARMDTLLQRSAPTMDTVFVQLDPMIMNVLSDRH